MGGGAPVEETCKLGWDERSELQACVRVRCGWGGEGVERVEAVEVSEGALVAEDLGSPVGGDHPRGKASFAQ